VTKGEYLMEVARLTSQVSTCSRLQVGCVITDWNCEKIAVGYNGGPKGGINECRHPDAVGGCGCIHAESNAVIKADFVGDRRAFVTCSPCPLCAVMLVNANVKFLAYAQAYRDPEGLEVLRECGVTVVEAATL
jgi:dCMP deaminase